MIVADLMGGITCPRNNTLKRVAIEEIQSEILRLCYEQIPLNGEDAHRMEYLPLRQGSPVPMRVQCNGVTVAKVYDSIVGYVVEFSMGAGE